MGSMNKLIIYMIMCILLSSFTFAVLPDAKNCYSLDTGYADSGVGVRSDLIVFHGSPTAIGGKVGGAYYFDNNDGVYNTTLDSPETIQSFVYWVNYTDIIIDEFAFSIGGGSNDHVYGIADQFSDTSLEIWGSYQDHMSTRSFSVNTWYHVVQLLGTGGQRVYVNGELDDFDADTDLLNALAIVFALNEDATADGGRNADVAIDEFAMYTERLTDAQINESYNSGAGVSCTPVPVDTTPPTYVGNSTNVTSGFLVGDDVQFLTNWTDETALSYCVLAHNNSGTIVNQTVFPINGEPTDFELQENITLTSKYSGADSSVTWQTSCNDTNNNWGSTDVNTLTMNNTFPSIPTDLTINTTIHVGEVLNSACTDSTDSDDNSITYYYEFYNTNDTSIVQAYSITATYTILQTDAHDDIRVRCGSYDSFDYSDGNDTETVSITNSLPPAITVWNTPATSDDTFNDNITFDWDAVTDADGDTVYYTFYLNETIKQNTTGDDWVSDFTHEGHYNYTVITYDGIGEIPSEVRLFKLDTTATVETRYTPIDKDSAGNFNLTVNYSWFDKNLFRVFYNLTYTSNYTTLDYGLLSDNITFDSYNWSVLLNFSLIENYTLFTIASDDHHIIDGSNFIDYNTKVTTKIDEVKINDKVGVLLTSNTLNDIPKKVTYNKLYNRVSFVFDTKPGMNTYQPYCDGELFYREISKYKAHFTCVFSNYEQYFIDFENDDGYLVIVKEIKDGYEIKTLAKSFNTIGGLNIDVNNITYYYDYEPPDYDNDTVINESPVKIGTRINVNVTYTDNSSLQDWIMSTNQSGSRVNDTINVTFEDGKVVAYIDVTIARGNEIYWTLYVRDSLNNTNRSMDHTILVDNSEPVTGNPSLNDLTPQTNDILTCNVGTYSDADSDVKANDYYRWYLNGTIIGGETTSTLDLSTPNNGDLDDLLNCEWIADDSFDNSSSGWLGSANATVVIESLIYVNTTPGNGSIDINNSVFVEVSFNLGLLNISSCIIQFDNVNYTGNIDETFCNEEFIGLTDGLNYTFRVFVNDTNDNPYNSTPRTFIENSIQPDINQTDIVFNSSQIRGNEDLLCIVNMTGNDPEGNTTLYNLTLFINDTEAMSQESTVRNITMNATDFISSDNITCQVLLYDSYEYSAGNNNSIIIYNEIPIANDVAINGSFVDSVLYSNSTVTGNYTFTDAEGDTDSSDYGFWVNSTYYNTTYANLSKDNTSRYDVVIFSITPYDGTDYGVTVNSSPYNISGIPPTIHYLSPNQGHFSKYIPIDCYASNDDGDLVYYYVSMYFDNGTGTMWNDIINNETAGNIQYSLKNISVQNNVSIKCNATTDFNNYVYKTTNGSISFVNKPEAELTYIGAREVITEKIPYKLGIICDIRASSTNLSVFGSWGDCGNDGLKDYYWNEEDISIVTRKRTFHSFTCISLKGEEQITAGCIFKKENTNHTWLDVCSDLPYTDELCTYKVGISFEVESR